MIDEKLERKERVTSEPVKEELLQLKVKRPLQDKEKYRSGKKSFTFE
jgi:hypothetical protein